MRIRELPTLEYLNECFILSEDSPSGLIWKRRPLKHFNCTRGWNCANTKFAGKNAGTFTEDKKSESSRYYSVKMSQHRFTAHCIVYAMFNKDCNLLGLEVDHIDRNPINNRPSNLRKATASQNQMNRGIQKNNKSGLPGVSFSKVANKWRADIHLRGKQSYLGYFETKELAHQAYCKAAKVMHGQFSRDT